MENKPKSYIDSYLAGFLLGLVLLAAFVITGRGLGASGTMKSLVIAGVLAAAPEYAAKSPFYADFFSSGENPLLSWLVFLSLGVIIGGLVSGAANHRLGLKLEKGPNIKPITRAICAILGGALFGLGAQFGRGCTSGTALTGMAVLSSGGILTMMAIFGTGYLLAWFFRKLWI